MHEIRTLNQGRHTGMLTVLDRGRLHAQSLSTFALDLQQMAHALNNATASSLVIVDEFGKGVSRPSIECVSRLPFELTP